MTYEIRHVRLARQLLADYEEWRFALFLLQNKQIILALGLIRCAGCAGCLAVVGLFFRCSGYAYSYTAYPVPTIPVLACPARQTSIVPKWWSYYGLGKKYRAMQLSFYEISS